MRFLIPISAFLAFVSADTFNITFPIPNLEFKVGQLAAVTYEFSKTDGAVKKLNVEIISAKTKENVVTLQKGLEPRNAVLQFKMPALTTNEIYAFRITSYGMIRKIDEQVSNPFRVIANSTVTSNGVLGDQPRTNGTGAGTHANVNTSPKLNSSATPPLTSFPVVDNGTTIDPNATAVVVNGTISELGSSGSEKPSSSLIALIGAATLFFF